jgi:2-enoate reductase
MEKKYEPLFTPWKIGNVEIKNRIVMLPMGGTCIFGFSEPNHFDKEAAKLLLTIAQNDCGLILPGIAPVHDMVGPKWLYQGKGKFKQLKKFMDEVHKTGAKLFIQLTAGFGRSFAVSQPIEAIGSNPVIRYLAKPILNVDDLTAAPSAEPNRWSDKIPSKEITIKRIHKLVDAFAKTAKLCKEAGVDGIEVHAVHEGYLIDQFTMKYTNHRKDEYGGSFENRYRFPVEIVHAIKDACGKDYPVSLRYSVVSKTKGYREGALPGEDYVEAGRDLEEGLKAAKYLQDAGYDMLNCDNGTYDAWYWNHPPMYMPQNCNYMEAEEVKKVVSIPVVVGGRNEPDFGAQKIKENKVDAMGVGRQFLADPEWIHKMINENEDDIRPCICCHSGCFNLCHYKGVPNDQTLTETRGMCHCAVNPSSMNSKKYHIEKAKKSKTVAVIGGGIAGMEAARVLALRGHKPTIYEKSNVLGGVFIPAASFSFKEKDRALIAWYIKQVKDLNIPVVFNSEIKDLSTLKEDEVIVATGAKARVIRVPGYEKALSAVDFLNNTKTVGDNVLIIGGSLTGCEIAYDLCLKGKKPIIVEMKDDLIAAHGVCLANSSYLRDYFALNKTPVYLESKIKEIKDGSAVITTKDGKDVTIKCDDVIMCVGYSANPISKDKKVHLIGDCNKVGNIMSAVWNAWDIAMKL